MGRPNVTATPRMLSNTAVYIVVTSTQTIGGTLKTTPGNSFVSHQQATTVPGNNLSNKPNRKFKYSGKTISR